MQICIKKGIDTRNSVLCCILLHIDIHFCHCLCVYFCCNGCGYVISVCFIMKLCICICHTKWFCVCLDRGGASVVPDGL